MLTRSDNILILKVDGDYGREVATWKKPDLKTLQGTLNAQARLANRGYRMKEPA